MSRTQGRLTAKEVTAAASKAVETLTDAERIARRVLGGTHPLSINIEGNLQCARATLELRTLELRLELRSESPNT